MHALGNLRKYLLHLSYIGDEFSGMQKQLPNISKGKAIVISTVQQTIDDTIKLLFNPLHDVKTRTSSRTDAGVHALHSTVDVHLQKEVNLHPDLITSKLNRHFALKNIGIRINKSEVIPEWFSAQKHAISRKYLYRLAIRKEPVTATGPIYSKYLNEYPFSEHKRIFVVNSSNINIQLMQEAAEMMEGTHDFLSFMSRASKRADNMKTIRSLYSVKILPGRPYMPQQDPYTDFFNYWNIIFHGRSFLYKQVRRMVGVLLAVGQGVVTLEDVRRLINEPNPDSWNPRAVCVPPYGLYLLEVNYNPLDFRIQQQEDDSENIPATFAMVDSLN